MKPSESISSFNNQENYIKEKIIDIDSAGSNLIIIHGRNELDRTRFILNLISQLIDENRKSTLWLSHLESLKMEDMFFMLMSIRLNCSIRDIKNPTFLKNKSATFLREKEIIDSLVSFEKHYDWADLDRVANTKYLGYHFFISINNNMTVLERQMKMRELNKFCRISRGRCIVASSLHSYEANEILLKDSLYSSRAVNFKIENSDEDGKLKVFRINQHGPDYEDDPNHNPQITKHEYKTFYLQNETYEDQIKKPENIISKIRVDPKTQLFCKLSDKNILDLKTLGLKIAKTGKINLNNEYVRLWINACGIDEVEKLKTLLPIKIYISIANRLDLAMEKNSTTL